MTGEEKKTGSMWVHDKGYVPKSKVTADDLASNVEHLWRLGRPPETLKGISVAKRPQVKNATTVAQLERLILEDGAIGEGQRGRLLQEVRWFANYVEARREIG